MKKIFTAVMVVFCMSFILSGCGGSKKVIFDDFGGRMSVTDVRAIMGEPDEVINEYKDPTEDSVLSNGLISGDIDEIYHDVDLFGYKGSVRFCYGYEDGLFSISDSKSGKYSDDDTWLIYAYWTLESGRGFTEKEYNDISKKLTKKYGDPSIEQGSEELENVWYDEKGNKYSFHKYESLQFDPNGKYPE